MENLSGAVMEGLVRELDVTLEFFEAYLSNAGWDSGRYSDANPKTWSTARLNKQYVTLQWPRPVGFNLPDLDRRVKQLPYSSGECHWYAAVTIQGPEPLGPITRPDGVWFMLSTTANILRSHQYVRALPAMKGGEPHVS